MGKKTSGKVLVVVALLAWVFVVRFLTACSVEKEELEKVRDLEFTVVGETDLPEELKNVIEEKKMGPFKLTYTDDQNLYIVVGYGEQETGGYSISVKELYLTENAIVTDTELLGPQTGETTGVEKSYPFVVIKTEYLEQPVIFQ
ncbi:MULTISPECIES: protease complex subunit PrcB family protein [unclassified Clostridium]|uniref:protease complex subunit PrcB family protein n=1 Tax=unclassified Clostridium TaxID=2614128 RepID=UPI000E497E43|nr:MULTISPECIES: protease complex subunit PrcB family protein [unclassified Clostridium]RHP49567.1 protease complex subunit PrcB family protein [Clostridium sp. AF32-12BH]RHV67169.1 protease complex subunit PrcB family protein [Clostridium sp. OM02-18AC]